LLRTFASRFPGVEQEGSVVPSSARAGVIDERRRWLWAGTRRDIPRPGKGTEERMKISCCWLYAISKYGYPPSVENSFRAIREMAALGFRYVELEGVGEANMLAVWERRGDFAELCRELGVQIVNFCPILPQLFSSVDSERRRGLELFELGVELARYFGAPTVQIDSFTPPVEFVGDAPYREALAFGKPFRVRVNPEFDYERYWAILVEMTRECARRAGRAGLWLTMEPRVGESVSNTDALLRLIEHVGEPNFGAVLDTAHLHAQKEILPLSVEKLGRRIRYLHVADNDGRDNLHLALGEGTIDFEGVFLALKKHGFRGYVAVDVGHVPDLDDAYRRSVAYLEALARQLGV
jgi:sugar phosphate isomerase/epimerase